jgi:hypothetical protein
MEDYGFDYTFEAVSDNQVHIDPTTLVVLMTVWWLAIVFSFGQERPHCCTYSYHLSCTKLEMVPQPKAIVDHIVLCLR